VREDRNKGSAYYERQYLFDREGNLLGLHDADGTFYVSTSLAGRLTTRKRASGG
jgi:hypothetical protein